MNALPVFQKGYPVKNYGFVMKCPLMQMLPEGVDHCTIPFEEFAVPQFIQTAPVIEDLDLFAGYGMVICFPRILFQIKSPSWKEETLEASGILSKKTPEHEGAGYQPQPVGDHFPLFAQKRGELFERYRFGKTHPFRLVNTSTYGDIRTLAVERIQNIKKTGESFEYPEGFDPEALLESAFDMVYGDPVKVRICFSADQVRYVKERKWSKNQEIVDQEGGSIILSLDISGAFQDTFTPTCCMVP
jgi:hypothetical protein